jgi:site-specific recombinase XerD
MITVNDQNDTRKAAEAVVLAIEEHGRSEPTIKDYRRAYEKFLSYLEEKRVSAPPSEADCLGFIESMAGARLESLYEKAPDNRTGRIRRPLVLLLGMLRTGRVDVGRDCGRRTAQKCPPPFDPLLQDYLSQCLKRGNSQATIHSKRAYAVSLFAYMDASGIKDAADMTVRDISGFLLRFSHYKRKTTASLVAALRDLLRFLHGAGLTLEDMSARLPKQRCVRNEATPYLWGKEEIAAVLGAIDRASAIGKRDYAMILLVVRLGLRTCDLRLLELSSLDWRAKALTVVQSKTGRPLQLPLLDDVGWAVIDYVKNGRPETSCQKVFVKHRYPFDEFGAFGSAASRLYRYAKKAGIAFPDSKLHGMHSLRSALARTMLKDGTPLPTITEVLGHADPNTTTSYYLRLDTDSLRSCAQDVEDIIGRGTAGAAAGVSDERR